jgi:two-component system chemotaxis sensor kinase CheA
MSETVDRAGTDLRLREQIDELATRLILDGASRDLAAALAQLSEQIGQSGCPEAARIASGLAERIDSGTADAPGFGDSLDSEIARLQQALENEAHRQVAAPADARAHEAPPASNPLAQSAELVGDFITESREHLCSIESRMLVLEQNPGDMEAIHSVFRGFHTIKGLAGFLEFADIREVSHEVETLLDLARDSKLAITPAVVDVVLESADYLKQAIEAVEASMAGKTPALFGDHGPLRSRMRNLMAGASPESQSPSQEPAAEPPRFTAKEEGGPGSIAAAPKEAPAVATPGKAPDTLSIRVDTGKLDSLMDMVGEMVIAQSLIRHNPSLGTIQDPRLQRDLSQLARITSDVQRTTMSMRMLPIGHLFQRTARLVRDLSRKAGKLVELETSGEETELDKTIAEELADPLMHMVRNAIDHGVEAPDVRVAVGKSPSARVKLAAYHQAGQIVVEISDDGRGLDREKILKKARQNGLIDDSAQLTDTEIFHLIFEPGFSTAEQVTDISGRGVGMDVVRKHVQKLRGRIDIQSKAGHGATFFLKLPLTLAIIEGLVVVVGDQRYIVPIFAVKEMFRPTSGTLSTIQGRDEMALVRGRLLPVVRLYQRFGVRPRSEDPCQGLLVVAESGGRQYCVLVDDLEGKQEVVIKSLGESLKNIAGVAGGAILGDGRVGLILDMDGVFSGGRRE